MGAPIGERWYPTSLRHLKTVCPQQLASMTSLDEHSDAQPIDYRFCLIVGCTLESGINVSPWINVAPGKFGKKNKCSPIYTLFLYRDSLVNTVSINTVLDLTRFFSLNINTVSWFNTEIFGTPTNFGYNVLVRITWLGPLHVLWQVSLGCWVTWFISSWQE